SSESGAAAGAVFACSSCPRALRFAAGSIDRKQGGTELAAIALEGVTKAWGESRGVDRISFSTAAGKFLVLLGPSGCGKSTTLRLIAGLAQADSGRILIAAERDT